ncbi:hypothetical protein ACFZCG_29290 [Streptomyces tanashiensis]|uniref:hypothetical protein n=1 Tax=Streptomyces tanashiensis TaxID=67367 RepID=UPI0036F04C9A
MTSPVEERLRAALAARAALVTYRDLRRDAPPQGRRWGTHRVRAVAFAVLGAAAAVAAVCALALLPGRTATPDPVLPARSPSPAHTGAPAVPTPAPAPPAAPSVSAPRPVESP